MSMFPWASRSRMLCAGCWHCCMLCCSHFFHFLATCIIRPAVRRSFFQLLNLVTSMPIFVLFSTAVNAISEVTSSSQFSKCLLLLFPSPFEFSSVSLSWLLAVVALLSVCVLLSAHSGHLTFLFNYTRPCHHNSFSFGPEGVHPQNAKSDGFSDVGTQRKSAGYFQISCNRFSMKHSLFTSDVIQLITACELLQTYWLSASL